MPGCLDDYSVGESHEIISETIAAASFAIEYN